MQATSKKTVNVPIARVWEVLSDHEGMSSWGPGMKAVLAKPGTTDRNGVGAVRRLGAALPKPVIVEEITAFEPGRRLGYKALSGVPLKNYGGDVVLREVPGGTEITYSVFADKRLEPLEKVVLKGISASLLAALVRAARA
jgi:uncharacterized protein YndB with AHSA1/START domain